MPSVYKILTDVVANRRLANGFVDLLRSEGMSWRVRVMPIPMIVPVVVARVATWVVRMVLARGWSSAKAVCGKYRDILMIFNRHRR